VRIAEGRSHEAAELLLDATGIVRRTLGEKHPTYVLILENAAKLQHANRERGATQRFLELAAQTALEIYGEKHPEYAETLRELASVYRLLQQPDLESKLQREAEAILTRAQVDLQQVAVQKLNRELDRRLR
jgi:hypothetical protein